MESEEENESIRKKRKRIPNKKICSLSDDEQEEQREKQLPRPPLVKQINVNNTSKHLEKGISTYFIYIQMCVLLFYITLKK